MYWYWRAEERMSSGAAAVRAEKTAAVWCGERGEVRLRCRQAGKQAGRQTDNRETEREVTGALHLLRLEGEATARGRRAG
jgi:hypothetical protein